MQAWTTEKLSSRATGRAWRSLRAASLALIFASCGGGNDKSTVVEPPPPNDQQYVNPVINADFPDPSAMKASDGNYYAYATQTTGIRLQVSHSTNLVTWSSPVEAMPTTLDVRPPMLAGPMLRQRNAASRVESSG